MKSRIFLCALISGIWTFGQELELYDSTKIELEEVNLVDKLPITSEKISKRKLNQKNLGQDIPSLLQQSTSTVTTSDAGTGIGYSSVRIRGIAQEHINITLNGVTLNDPETQNVFWVNMPDLASSAQSITIQRGVGTSSSGTGAFGAIINIDVANPSRVFFLESANSWGSFATQKYSLQGGTGEILNGKIRMDFNASLIKSDGYIDRAFSDLYSYGMNIKYDVTNKTSLRYWTSFGKEKTYQAWNGIDQKTMKTDRTFNSSGAIYNDDWSEIIGFYDNETDNYQQHHNHLIWQQDWGKNWNSSTTLFYTKGKGYYENYKQDADLSEYKLISNFETSDLVRQKWLDNNFYGVNVNAENQNLGLLKLFTGISLSQFENEHYGIVNWVKDFQNPSTQIEFYRNSSKKTDVSVYAKTLIELGQWEIFGDVQFRSVRHIGKAIPGGENEFEDFKPFEGNFQFLNPKIGINFQLKPNHQFYFFYGLAHREPHRGDFLGNPNLPKTEKLHDFELGYKKHGRANFSANLFYMYYIDQLVATGELDDVGAFIRTNSGQSFRAGIELQGNYDMIPRILNVFGNLTYSLNENIDYHEIGYDGDGNEIMNSFGKTALSFSPNWVGSIGLNFAPIKSLEFNLSNKFVGEQFLTNTELENGKLDSYFITDFLIRYAPKIQFLKTLEFSLYFNNLLDVSYESNGFFYEQPYYYPQAGLTILGGLKIRL